MPALFRRAARPPEAPEPTPKGPGWYWMQHPLVAQRINTLISGNAHVDAYAHLAAVMKDREVAFPLGHCASLGSGQGGLERDLSQRGMVRAIDGYEPSQAAVAAATQLAAEHGFPAIRYTMAGLHAQTLPAGRYDAVFTYSALHRVEKLEEVLAAMRASLKPGGFIHLHEFVGPSRFQWTDHQVDLINGFLDSLPDRLLQTPDGRKPPVQRPSLMQMQANDATLAVRSAEIREVLGQFFDVVEERPFGGTLLHMGLADIAQNFSVDDPADVAQLERFFGMEDDALARGELGSDFAVFTATPAAAIRPASRTPATTRFGTPPTRQLRPPPGFAVPGLSLTVSRADNMLTGTDAQYLSVGQSALRAIERALGGTEPRSILDLPCGFGRVTRAIRARFPHAAITVSDLDRPGVDFSAGEFGARAAYSVRDFRELDLQETYDLIWVGSLMTHLPPQQTKDLLSALQRHLSPGGVLLITLQGPSIIPRLRETGYGLPPGSAEQVIAEFGRTGFGYADYKGGEDVYGVSLTNDNYGISLTDKPWMEAALHGSGLVLEAYDVQGWDNHHDVAVARRPREG